MENKKFLDAYELIKLKLEKLEVNHVFNSIGSNIFIELGKDIEIESKNGRKSSRKEWSIWVSNASWKISKNEKYIVGSGDPRETIQLHIKELLEKRFHSLKFKSRFLDAEFTFSGGYKLTTFFDRIAENQWTIFLPDQSDIGSDCTSYEAIKEVQAKAKHFSFIEDFKELDLLKEELYVGKITYDKNDEPTFCFGNTISLNFQNCTWRLEKDQEYIVGYLDGDRAHFNTKINKLIGKKLIQISIAPNLMEARFEFEDLYVLKTFTCAHTVKQWRLTLNSTSLFQAVI